MLDYSEPIPSLPYLNTTTVELLQISARSKLAAVASSSDFSRVDSSMPAPYHSVAPTCKRNEGEGFLLLRIHRGHMS
jgi:hypothetical protein